MHAGRHHDNVVVFVDVGLTDQFFQYGTPLRVTRQPALS
jgi:hypothetical protein